MFNTYDMEQETLERLTNSLAAKLEGTGVNAREVAVSILRDFAVIGKGAVEFHQEPHGEWTAVYVYGKLAESPGDNYHADELLQQVVGVVNHQDSDFVLADGRSAPDTLSELAEFQASKATTALEKAIASAEEARAKAIAKAEAEFQAATRSA